MVSYDLPLELIIEILIRLPTIYLLRFKSVCKTWYALIQNPSFIEKHHQFKSNLNSVLVNTSNRIYINYDGCYKPIDFDYKFSGEVVKYELLGLCNGLLCTSFVGCRAIIIGNPMTREFRVIPDLIKFLSLRNQCKLFGFSSFSDDYKLVILFYSSFVRAEVYSMSTDSWETIDVKMGEKVVTCPHDTFYNPSTFMPVVLNGVFHWMASSCKVARIVSLDINKGLFYETKIPTNVVDPSKDSWRIIKFDEKLCLIISKDNEFEVWGLAEDRSTWSLKMKIKDIPRMLVPNKYEAIGRDILECAKNGELLVEEGIEEESMIFSYDLHSQETKILPLYDDNYDFNTYYFCNESLRWVKPMNEVAEDGQNLPKPMTTVTVGKRLCRR